MKKLLFMIAILAGIAHTATAKESCCNTFTLTMIEPFTITLYQPITSFGEVVAGTERNFVPPSELYIFRMTKAANHNVLIHIGFYNDATDKGVIVKARWHIIEGMPPIEYSSWPISQHAFNWSGPQTTGQINLYLDALDATGTTLDGLRKFTCYINGYYTDL